MSVENKKKETKASTSAFKVASTPQGKGVSEPPPKSKWTISEVSDASAEELTIIHQQLEHLNTDLKQTKEKVMSLMRGGCAELYIRNNWQSSSKSGKASGDSC